MKNLSNNLLREKSMKELLNAMGIDLTGIQVSSSEKLFCFSIEETKRSEKFATQLNELIQDEEIKQAYLSRNITEIIKNEIEEATCDNDNIDSHKEACKAIFFAVGNMGTLYSFSQEFGLEISFVNAAYASPFKLLNYSHMAVNKDGELIFNIENYLQEKSERVVRIESPTGSFVFIKSEVIESKIFYASKPLPDNAIELTPYFVVPQDTKPPFYHFVLDISESMQDGLPKLKNSVKQLANQLFIFQPDAKLTITTFSAGVHLLGSYTRVQKEKLERDVNNIRIKSNTPLYEVIEDFLNQIMASKEHNNILLFTDGHESGSKPGAEKEINDIIAKLGTEETNTTIRNKFYVFSYDTKQSELVQKIANIFRSEVIDTKTADFINAHKDPELMKKWAAARELFNSRIVINENTGNHNEITYSMPLDMSGQIVALKPSVCNSGETIEVSITDGDGKSIAVSCKKIRVPNVIANASIMANIGLLGFNEKEKQISVCHTVFNGMNVN